MKPSINKQLFAIAALAIMNAGGGLTSAHAETTECTQIQSLPYTITIQGIYCFKHDLVTAMTVGNAITVNTNNVTIDMNGFKLGGSSAGTGTTANGVFANNRKNITIRNGTIRGFYNGIGLNGAGSGHLIEQVRADQNRTVGFMVAGENNIIRDNHVINTGPGTVSTGAYGILASSVSNSQIVNNIISGVSETSLATGITVYNGSNVEIRGNSIFGVKDATNRYGIESANSAKTTVRRNQVSNAGAQGSTGIVSTGTSSGLACIENVTTGYTNPRIGCSYSFNHLNY